LSAKGELRREFLCAQAPGPNSGEVEKVTLQDCHGMKDNQEWIYTKVLLLRSFFSDVKNKF
jgi:hypothetical protein